MPAAYSYERVSTGKQAQAGSGLERQQEGAALWCQRNGYTLDSSLDLTDKGSSAFSGDHLSDGALGRFLALAKQGRLGPNPVLLVEAIDRLSRLEPMDGLRSVVFALADAGVRIVTLEDGASYSTESLNNDPASLIVLVVKIQAASDYSKRLSKRISATWEKTRQRIRSGAVDRGSHCPFWLDHDPISNTFTINEGVRLLERIYELAESGLGTTLLSRALNEEGWTTPYGKRFTAANVGKWLEAEEPCGVRRLVQYKAKREHGKRRLVPISTERIEDYYPVVIAPERRLAALAAVAARRNNPGTKGRRAECLFLGQGITFCATCGTLCGHARSGHGRRAESYVRCRARKDGAPCGQRYVRMDTLHAHVLTRLNLQQLALIWPAADGMVSAIHQEEQAVSRLRDAQAVASSKAATLQARVVEAAADGTALSLLKALQDAADLAAADAAETQVALMTAQGRLAALQQQPSASTAAKELQPLVKELFTAVLRKEDTPTQRWAVNHALQRLGIRLHLDANAMRCGIQVGKGVIDWQQMDAPLEIAALRRTVTGGVHLEAEVDAETAALFERLPKDSDGFVDLNAVLQKALGTEGDDKSHPARLITD